MLPSIVNTAPTVRPSTATDPDKSDIDREVWFAVGACCFCVVVFLGVYITKSLSAKDSSQESTSIARVSPEHDVENPPFPTLHPESSCVTADRNIRDCSHIITPSTDDKSAANIEAFGLPTAPEVLNDVALVTPHPLCSIDPSIMHGQQCLTSELSIDSNNSMFYCASSDDDAEGNIAVHMDNSNNASVSAARKFSSASPDVVDSMLTSDASDDELTECSSDSASTSDSD